MRSDSTFCIISSFRVSIFSLSLISRLVNIDSISFSGFGGTGGNKIVCGGSGDMGGVVLFPETNLKTSRLIRLSIADWVAGKGVVVEEGFDG